MAIINTYTIRNKNNITLEISTLGAAILSLKVPNKKNKETNVVVGLNSKSDYISEAYLKHNLYLGATVGRYAGRISKKEVVIEGNVYPLYHEKGVHLHGGKVGFDKKYWTVESIKEEDSSHITLSYLSKDLEEGYPGNLKMFVTYTLTQDNVLKIAYKATTDKTTIVNLTNHSYFNLSGKDSILNHDLFINSDSYLDTDERLIPSGKLTPVDKGEYNYKNKRTIRNNSFKGLDTTFVLNKEELKAAIISEESGISMEVYTNQPSMVVYTPEKFKDLSFKDGVSYSDYPAICFETQCFPDAPNNKHFPTTILKPNETYLNETMFAFSLIN